jgi:hypothetical protein
MPDSSPRARSPEDRSPEDRSLEARSPEERGVLVVRESRVQRDGLFGFLSVAFAVALARALAESRPPAVLVVLFSALVVFVLATWWFMRRHPDRLEVSADRIRYVTTATGNRARTTRPDFVRADGGEVQFSIGGGGGPYRYRTLRLTQVATSHTWELRFFTRKPIAAACRQRGWRVSG